MYSSCAVSSLWLSARCLADRSNTLRSCFIFILCSCLYLLPCLPSLLSIDRIANSFVNAVVRRRYADSYCSHRAMRYNKCNSTMNTTPSVIHKFSLLIVVRMDACKIHVKSDVSLEAQRQTCIRIITQIGYMYVVPLKESLDCNKFGHV